MKIHNKISGVFIKFFLTHLVILVIPITILGIVSNGIIVKIMTDQIAQEERNEISKSASDMNAQLQKLLDIGFKASNSQEFSPHIISNFAHNSLSLMEKLRTYKTANSFISDIFLVSGYSEYVYSPSTSYSLQRFIDQKLDQSFSNKELFQILSSAYSGKLNSNLFSPPKSSKGGMYLIYTLPSSGVKHYGYLIFEISKQYLSDFSDAFVQSEHKKFMIVYEDGIVITSTGFDAKMQENVIYQLKTAKKESKDGIFELVVDGQKIGCCYASTAYSDWVCVSTLPKTDTLLQVNSVVGSFTITVVILLLFGILAIYMVAQLNYSPIKKLANAAGVLFQKTIGTGSKNELHYLRDLIDETHQSIKEISEEQDNSLLARQYFLIKNLINGVRYAPDVLDGLLRKAHINFHQSNFFAAVFHVHIRNNNEQESITEMNDYLTTYSLEGIIGSAANLYGENIIAIYSSEHADLLKINGELESLRQALCEKFQVQITLGTGCLKPDLSEISSSFIEASTALDFRFINGKNITISFHELKLKVSVEVLYPQPYIDNLCNSVKNGQEKNATLTLKSLITYIRENSTTMYEAKLLCHDVINSVIKILNGLDTAGDFEIHNPNSISLANFETMEELEHMLEHFCMQCCAHVNALPALTISDRAISYMKDHFVNPDFSINGLSETLGISAAHLSRTFKEQKGITINDYVKTHKLELAKKMLTETNDSIEKITHLLGYYDPSSFIKKFKGEIGITPGEFRKLHKSRGIKPTSSPLK